MKVHSLILAVLILFTSCFFTTVRAQSTKIDSLSVTDTERIAIYAGYLAMAGKVLIDQGKVQSDSSLEEHGQQYTEKARLMFQYSKKDSLFTSEEIFESYSAGITSYMYDYNNHQISEVIKKISLAELYAEMVIADINRRKNSEK